MSARAGMLRRLEQSAIENEKAIRQRGWPFLSRENSSNGGSKTIRTFWQKSYGAWKASVKEFLHIKHICFQQLKQHVNIFNKMTKFAVNGPRSTSNPIIFSLLRVFQIQAYDLDFLRAVEAAFGEQPLGNDSESAERES